MADETLNLAFQQFLAEQKKTNQLLHQQAAGDKKGDNIIASTRNAAAEMINDSRLAIKNRKEHDQTQEAIVSAEKENTKKVETVESAVTKSGDKQTKAIEDLVGAQTTAQSAATKSAAATTTAVKSSNANAFNHHLAAQQQYEETKEREMRLLKVNEEQYEDIIKQRKIVEESKKELKEMGEAIKGDAKLNKEYQKKDLQLKREQAKLTARENRRGLLGRFKTNVAASKPVQMLGDVKRKFIDPVKGFFKKFPKIIGLALAALLLIFVNSDFYQKTFKFLKEYFAGKSSFGEVIDDITFFLGSLVVGLVLLKKAIIPLLAHIGRAALIKAFTALGVSSAVLAKLGLGPKVPTTTTTTITNPQQQPPKKLPQTANQNVRGTSSVPPASQAVVNAQKRALQAGGPGAARAMAGQAPPVATGSQKNPALNTQPGRTAALVSKFPALGRIVKVIPFLGPAVGAVQVFNALNDDSLSPAQKKKTVGSFIGGTALTAAAASVGMLIGGPPMSAIMGVVGYLLGDKLGEYITGMILGENIESQVNRDIQRARNALRGTDVQRAADVERLQGRIQETKTKMTNPKLRRQDRATLMERIRKDQAAIGRIQMQTPDAVAQMEGMKPVTGSGGGTGNGQPVIVAPTVNQGPVTEEKTALGGNIPVVDPSGLAMLARAAGSVQ